MSTEIIGIEEMSLKEIKQELRDGGKFVIYEYCISICILTFKRPTSIYFIAADESDITPGIAFSVISLFFGWWGFPWGPIYTIGSFITNFGGGKDVTREAWNALREE